MLLEVAKNNICRHLYEMFSNQCGRLISTSPMFQHPYYHTVRQNSTETFLCLFEIPKFDQLSKLDSELVSQFRPWLMNYRGLETYITELHHEIWHWNLKFHIAKCAPNQENAHFLSVQTLILLPHANFNQSCVITAEFLAMPYSYKRLKISDFEVKVKQLLSCLSAMLSGIKNLTLFCAAMV